MKSENGSAFIQFERCDETELSFTLSSRTLTSLFSKDL